ncbi:MAG: serine/threonine protein phosphatase [Deltaproteobacteria bacterium]|nr:serine/threonine protein phosphatase [Deltaproteobacteria bacterium]
MGRTFAIGDIHGCLYKLKDLLKQIEPGLNDTLIFLGDYIDRGYASRDVVDFLIDLADQARCVFLRGNHEEMFINFLEFGTNRNLYFANGGISTIMSYLEEAEFVSHSQVAKALPMNHRDFYAGLKWYYEDEGYIYVHAGVRPFIPFEKQVNEDLLWIRNEFIFSPTGLTKKVIFGHTPFTQVLIRDDKIGIDTGAVYGGCLTAICLPEEIIIQSPG